ncbi:PREDICTED: LOW QUALITY PROTEIN: F-box protein At2g05970-like [Camelina sativa]|uniref:LOW QUALITY PROTEIN: F-box protein At2g05970-like n=1 Tax=Camelina sativa TaxID=90675 RepID=A0ABM1R0D1_CAMSA|nr:PREDICTED: LOW QUALITY PROTEIN: F-box protein At2g05970-like [Camelina sativa]
MGQSKEKRNRTSKWSELCPDLLRCVLERLSITDFNRAKYVCSSWHSVSRGCAPKRNQIPWLILFPRDDIINNNNNDSCMLFVPDERDRVYRTRDLGVDFVQSCCLATYGSWLLMMDTRSNLNILNPLTGENIALPITTTKSVVPPELPKYERRSLACLWIDDRSKDYVVVWQMLDELVFTKKGNNNWRWIASTYGGYGKQLVYEHRYQKLYLYEYEVKVWCLSRDDPLEEFEFYYYPPLLYTFRDFLTDRRKDEEKYKREKELYMREYVDSRLNIAVSTVSGEVYKVANTLQKSKRWLFCVSKMNPINRCWQVIDSLGDEAVILEMGITVLAKDVPGFKRNSIYFSGLDYGRKNPDHIFVFDLTTQEIERLPQCVISSIRFSDARWFFPGFSG